MIAFQRFGRRTRLNVVFRPSRSSPGTSFGRPRSSWIMVPHPVEVDVGVECSPVPVEYGMATAPGWLGRLHVGKAFLEQRLMSSRPTTALDLAGFSIHLPERSAGGPSSTSNRVKTECPVGSTVRSWIEQRPAHSPPCQRRPTLRRRGQPSLLAEGHFGQAGTGRRSKGIVASVLAPTPRF